MSLGPFAVHRKCNEIEWAVLQRSQLVQTAWVYVNEEGERGGHSKRKYYGTGKDPNEKENSESGGSSSSMQMSCASRSSEEECGKADRKIRRASKRATQENDQEAPIEDGSKGEAEWTAENLGLQRTMVLSGIEELCMSKQHACLKGRWES